MITVPKMHFPRVRCVLATSQGAQKNKKIIFYRCGEPLRHRRNFRACDFFMRGDFHSLAVIFPRTDCLMPFNRRAIGVEPPIAPAGCAVDYENVI
jgi:hypothetical protein